MTLSGTQSHRQERVLSLDISTKTGWALIVSQDDTYDLERYGQVPKIERPDGPYPASFVDWAYICFGKIEALIEELHPDVLIIEETAGGSKSAHSQKILEFIHFLVARYVKDTSIKNVYTMTEVWRRETGCKMTRSERKHNDDVKKYKEKKGTNIAYDENGKRIGRLSRKHINIRRANEVFGSFLSTPLRKKDEDTADALLIAYSYHLRKTGALDVKQI